VRGREREEREGREIEGGRGKREGRERGRERWKGGILPSPKTE
jgi:hypothetical protein